MFAWLPYSTFHCMGTLSRDNFNNNSYSFCNNRIFYWELQSLCEVCVMIFRSEKTASMLCTG